MKTDDILKAAKERLAEIETEATKLRAIIAAATGPSIAPFISIQVLPPIGVQPVQGPFSPERPLQYEWHKRDRKPQMNPLFDDPICGVRPNDDGFIVGGPQRGDPNVRFAS